VSPVSIRAPARGATVKITRKGFNKLFQSAPPRGGRRQLNLRLDKVTVVSIRAPARGATKIVALGVDPTGVSIRAPARGATLLDPAEAAVSPFQSAPPRGGRHSSSLQFRLLYSFNPRPRAGGDDAR